MPLPKNYYTWDEALARVGNRLPDENAGEAVAESIRDGQLPAWFIDCLTKKRIEIEPYKVHTSSEPPTESTHTELRRELLGVAIRDNEDENVWPWVNPLLGWAELVVPSDSVAPHRYAGPVMVDKRALKNLLTKLKGSQSKGGTLSTKIKPGLEDAIHQFLSKEKEVGRGVSAVINWFTNNTGPRNTFESGVPECDELHVTEDGKRLAWIRADQSGDELSLRSLDPYIKDAISRL